MVDDVESPWLHGDNHFDFVHFRHVLPILKDPAKVLSEAYRYAPNSVTLTLHIYSPVT